MNSVVLSQTDQLWHIVFLKEADWPDTNGIGKTISTFDLLPSGTPIINSDEIAHLSSLAASSNINLQEYSNREALRLMDQYLQERKSFAIETNLADKDPWKFLLQIQQSGYQLDIIYLSTDNIETLNARIRERVLRGEHFVRLDIVFERYINGLKLLDFQVSQRFDIKKSTKKLSGFLTVSNYFLNLSRGCLLM